MARDSVADRLQPKTADAAPALPAAPRSLEEIVADLARLVGAGAERQAEINAALAGVIGDREKFLKEERADIDRLARCRAEAEKTAQQRTQEAADRKWPIGEARFQVSLLATKNIPDPKNPTRRVQVEIVDPAFPEVQINASSPEEADGRYRLICGINSTDHAIRKTPLERAA